MASEKSGDTGVWIVGLDKGKAPIGESLLYFGATRGFKDITGKLLPFSWVRSLNSVLGKYPNYQLIKCINKVVSPDREDMTDYMILAVLALKRDDIRYLVDSNYKISVSDANLYRRVGMLFSVSEDNQVGLFGLWPDELFKGVAKNQIHAKIIESLLVNRPNFWKNVIIMVTADYDWSSVFPSKH